MKEIKKIAYQNVEIVEIDSEHTEQRVDNFLISRLKGVPKSRVYRIIRKGEVRVNKKRVKQTYRLCEGDLLRIPPIRLSAPNQPPKRSSVEWLEDAIIYEDDLVLAIDKPSGIAVHGGSGIQYGVIEGLRALRSEAVNYELVHRLDRATSGVLLVAKKRRALRFLHEAIREHRFEKSYLALISGKLRRSQTVLAPLHKFTLSSGERVVKVDSAGKNAETIFTPKQNFATTSLVDIKIVTGRTHQIRVHGAHIGHPVAGDDRYGEREFNREMVKFGLKRLFLHAAELSFPHPGSNDIAEGEMVTVGALLPKQLLNVLDCL
jgi:23S rRNA pseudouridine955/2504/2580 synthase